MINRDELMKMACEYGMDTGCDCIEFGEDDVEKFYNAILERAALECENVKAVLDKDHEADEYCNFTKGARKGSIECLNAIRALKTQGE